MLYVYFPQADVAKLEEENSGLRAKEQTLLQRVRSLEADQRKQVEDGLRVRSSLDRYRQDMTQLDTEKREMTRQISEKDGELIRLREQMGTLQNQLDVEAKTKDKKT